MTRLDGNKNFSKTVYDGLNVTEIQADGTQLSSSYNLFGEKITSTDALKLNTTKYAYDHLGNLLSTTKSAKAEVWQQDNLRGNGVDWDMQASNLGEQVQAGEHYAYDELGRRIAILDAGGKVSLMRYDAQNNVIQTSYYAVSGNLQDPAQARTLLSDTISQQGKNGTLLPGTSRAGYDMFQRRLWSVDGAGQRMRWEYNNAGQLLSMTDMSNGQTRYSYDHAGQLRAQTSTASQNLRYTWDNGQMIGIEDQTNLQTTTYRYDLAGNRIAEKVQYTGTDAGTQPGIPKILQDNQIDYDAQNRIKRIKSPGSTLIYTYDANSNRLTVEDKGVLYHNSYDSMNRQIWVNALKDANGQYQHGARGHLISYDANGNRLTDSYQDKKYDKSQNTVISQGITEEVYRYDNLNRLFSIRRDGIYIEHRRYDLAGRLVEAGAVADGNKGSRSLNLSDAEAKRLIEGFGLKAEKRSYAYDKSGLLERQRNLTLTDGSNKASDVYFLQQKPLTWDKVTGEVLTVDANTWISGYDGAGNVTHYVQVAGGTRYFRQNRYLKQESYKLQKEYLGTDFTTGIYDSNGNRLAIADKNGVYKMRFWYDASGHILAKWDGSKLTTNLVVNNEVLGVENADNSTNQPPLGTVYEKTGPGGVGDAPRSYVVQNNGETLRSVARGLWGDAGLWYSIADENGLDGSATLTAGQILRIPAKPGSVHNDSSTYRPYDPSSLIGDTGPAMPQAKQKCGIEHVIVAFVAVAVTAWLGGGSASYVTKFFAGMAGSLAGQVAGNILHIQNGINWRAAVLAGVGESISFGIDKNVPQLAELKKFSPFLAGAAKGVMTNLATQIVGKVTHLQEEAFSWRSVVASGVEQGFMAEFGGGNLNLPGQFGVGLGAKALGQLVSRGRVDWKKAATDVFGNLIANSLVQQIIPPPVGPVQDQTAAETSRLNAYAAQVMAQESEANENALEMRRLTNRGLIESGPLSTIDAMRSAGDTFDEDRRLRAQALAITAKARISGRSENNYRGLLSDAGQIPVVTATQESGPQTINAIGELLTFNRAPSPFIGGLSDTGIPVRGTDPYSKDVVTYGFDARGLGGYFYLDKDGKKFDVAPQDSKRFTFQSYLDSVTDPFERFAATKFSCAQWQNDCREWLQLGTVFDAGNPKYKEALYKLDSMNRFALNSAVGTAALLTGGLAFNFAGGIGILGAGAASGVVGDVTIQGLGLGLHAASNGRFGRANIDGTELLLSGTLGAAFGGPAGVREAAQKLRQMGVPDWNVAVSLPKGQFYSTFGVPPIRIQMERIAVSDLIFPHTLKTLPENWIHQPHTVSIAPTQENANGLASKLALWATDQGAASGAATAYVDAQGGLWLGLSRDPGTKLNMFNHLDSRVAELNQAAGVKYWGTCAELQGYTSFANATGKLPAGGFSGAAQVGERFGIPAGTVINACPSCTFVNSHLGVGFIDSQGKIVIPTN